MLGLNEVEQKRGEEYDDTNDGSHGSQIPDNSATGNCKLNRGARLKHERRLVLKNIYIE